MMDGTVRVSELIRGLPIEALRRDFEVTEVTGVTHDSRAVSSGDLFVAVAGERFDGRDYAAEARKRGAAAVLAAGDPPAGYEGPWLRADDPRAAMGVLAARLYEHPDSDLVMVGVTGTNGKSTVMALVAAILEAAGRATGTVGTLGYRFEDLAVEAARTTPEATELFPLLRTIVDRGGEALVMEVSSHALSLERTAGVGFDLAVFTNLSRDHFDFHGGFEDYFLAKRRLFKQLKAGGGAVLNLEDPYGRRLAHELGNQGTAVTTFGGPSADVRLIDASLDISGTEARVHTPQGELTISTRLRGRFNLSNHLAAVASGFALGLDLDAVRRGIEGLAPLPGRLEPVDCGQSFPVFVDFAHTDGALTASLRSLREIAAGRKIVCVFGCGGDRDAGKRGLMGRAAGELADLPIVTSDNPRREDPLAIIAAVERGLAESGNEAYRVVPDRREAIARAIGIADEGWLVLVAGKGHEEGQVVGDEVRPFSDREELIHAIEAKGG